MKSKIAAKLILITVYLLIASLTVFAGGQDEVKAEEEQITITFSTWTLTEESTGTPIQVILEKFEEEHPNVKIEILGVPFAQYKDQLVIASTGGNPPDVIHGNSATMVTYYGLNLLEPLDSLAPAELISDIFPRNLEGVTFDGKIMAMPWAPHPNALFYNKVLMEKAGLDPDKPPVTWAEMDQMARQIAALGTDADGNKIWGIAIANGKKSHTGTVFEGMVLAHGGSYFDKQGRPQLESAPVKAAFKEMLEWAKDEVMPTGVWQVDIRGLFSAQTVGFSTEGDYGRGIYRNTSGLGEEFDKVMGVTVMPLSPVTGVSETVFTEHQLAVSKSSKHKELAMELVEHFIGEEMMIYYHGTNGVLSARESVSRAPGMKDAYTDVFIKQLETASPLPARNPEYDNAMLLVMKALERVLTNDEDIDSVLADTQKKVLDLYGM